jgi:uncharacterized protein (TIGR03067 family)
MRLLLFACVLSLGFAPAPSPKPRQPVLNDLERMQGTWDLVEFSYNGRLDYELRGRARVSGKRWTMRLVDGGRPPSVTEYRIVLDVTTTPCALDLREPQKFPHIMEGIYSFPDEHTLVFCYRSPTLTRDAIRPTTFLGENKAWVMVFRRVR